MWRRPLRAVLAMLSAFGVIESDGLEADTIVITDFDVTVDKLGKRNTSTPVDVTCTVNSQATGDLAEPIVFNVSTTLDISCATVDGKALKGRHRITIEATVFNRDDRTFTEQTTVRF